MTRIKNRIGALHGGDSKSAFSLIFVALATGIVIAGYFFYRNQEQQFRAEAEHQLVAIAELKEGELVRWREERLADACILFENATITALVRRFLEKPADADAQRQLQGWFDTYKAHFQYDQIRLLDAQGVNRLSLPAGLPAVSTALEKSVSEAQRSGQIVFQDFYRSDSDQKIRLGLVIPILYEADRSLPPGLIVLQIDPAKYLYPFIQRWPMPGKTGETLLLRRDGNDVLYLNELRHMENSTLALRIPMTRTEVPAVKTALGQTGIMPGVDYRGVPVLAAGLAVAGSPWFLIAKMDLKEVNAHTRERFWQMVVLLGALLLAAGAGVGLFWRQQHFRHFQEQMEASAKLRQSEEKFSKAFQTSPYAITITHAEDGRFVEANDAFTTIAGYSREEALADSSIGLKMWVNETDRQRVVDDLRAGRAVAGHEYRFRTKSGKEIMGLFSAQIIRLSQGTCILSSIDDITERKKEDQALIQSRKAALNMMTDAIAARNQTVLMSKALQIKNLVFDASISANSIADKSGTITEANQAFLRVWGYPGVKEVIGKPLLHFISDPNEAVAIVTALDSTGQWEGDYTAKRKDGSTFVAHGLATTVKDEKGTVIGYQSAVIDVTLQKEAEKELKEHRDHLGQLVAERTAQLHGANKELEAFAYSVSHDLRSPLRGIDGWSLALLEDYGSQLDEQAKTYLARVRSETQRMGRLIDDLLQLSRLTRAEMHTAQVNLSAIAHRVATQLQETAPERQVEFLIQPGLNAQVDAPLLEIALTNLLDNSFKFTAKTPDARVEFGQTESDGKRIFFVHDNGVGFDMALSKNLFGAFQRLHKASDFPGTGVGLTIVQRIIHRHGGRIWAEAIIQQGATFYFTLEERL